MVEKSTITMIYMYLLDEGTDVWRPVEAIFIRDSIYQINPDAVIPETETWQFLPGDIVRCEGKHLSKGNSIVAVAKVEFSGFHWELPV